MIEVLMVVVLVISILASAVYLSYGYWANLLLERISSHGKVSK